MALNEIGKVEAYEIISVNPITSETTTFRLDKNLTVNPCASYEDVMQASQSITGLTTATYSDTVLKTNVSVAERIEDLKPAPPPEPDYDDFPSRTILVKAVKLPSSASGYYNNAQFKLPTNYTAETRPTVQGGYMRRLNDDSTLHVSVSPNYVVSAGIHQITGWIFFNYSTAGTREYALYLNLNGTKYTFYVNLEVS